MRKFNITFGGILSLLVLVSCSGGSDVNKELDSASDKGNLQVKPSIENSSSVNEKNVLGVDGRLSKDTIAELLNQLKNIPPGDNYIVKGELKTDILKFKSVDFGDMIHFGFVNNKNEEYDFGGNITKIELEKGTTNPEDEDGYEANKKYVDKNFRVVWRTIKLKNEPTNEMEMYYEEFDQIIYLKQMN